jgi:ribosomal protection tetracycline resistance protein
VLGRTLNLGILAHVDAGKTTLTERLLHAAGVIDEIGSVDRGTTQTDTLALERQRGITIKSAVATFAVGGVTINLIDTPGHPDFIAEVERVLCVLDGAVLVVSAVEGVQAQTHVLMRALERLSIPTLFFVNKTDRAGADVERVAGEIREKLTPDPVVFSGSAITGDGVERLAAGIASRLPSRTGDPDAPVSAAVFKIERGPKGDKIAYVRLFAGTIRVRDRVHGDEKVTALAAFERGGAIQRRSVSAGQIAKLWGLRTVRIGDRIGAGAPEPAHAFAPPTLETVVEPADPADARRLRVALDQLAEQDPLIGLRQGEHGELSLTIYGEVQKEVIQATLAADFGLAVSFHETTPIYVERPRGQGEAVELLNAPGNPFHAQLGLRVEPGEGVEVRVAIADHARIPLYVYKRREEFDAAMDGYIRDALRRGPHGWEVVDCVVTVFDSWYSLADGPPSRRGPMPTAGDFRGLTPIVLQRALARAGTVVCEPVLRVRVEAPAASLGAVIGALARLGAAVEAPIVGERRTVVECLLAAAHLHTLQGRLPGLTGGEGVLESSFAGYRPAVSAVPG